MVFTAFFYESESVTVGTEGSHDVGRRTAGEKFAFHEIHCRSDMFEELVIAFAEVVQSGFSVRGMSKAILRAFSVAGEKILAFTALARQRVQFRIAE